MTHIVRFSRQYYAFFRTSLSKFRLKLIPHRTDTIIALATPPGKGAIGVIRLSGPHAIAWTAQLMPKKRLADQLSHTLHYGLLYDLSGVVIDEVVVSLYRTPKSYTKEDVIEISAHGSPYILNQIIAVFLQMGARLAEPGEFTLRAYLNGGMDLAQAEAVADLIASQSEQGKRLALSQLRGGFSKRLKQLRQELLDLASLIELELDFSEEDVEFAQRSQIQTTVQQILREIHLLTESFRTGNAYKNGIPTVIVGRPNVGKSTLLNALLNENKAIVSDIPGTTRDVIEDRLFIGGYEFLIMDTAGIRESDNAIEAEGIKRTLEKMNTASLILWVADAREGFAPEPELQNLPAEAQVLRIANKADQLPTDTLLSEEVIYLSALHQRNLDGLQSAMVRVAESFTPYDTIVSNQRHVAALQACEASLEAVLSGIQHQLSSELLAIDLRQCLYDLGLITGEVTNDELLGNIFSKFCIGK